MNLLRTAPVLLVLLTVAALGLRISGTGRMLPHLAEPDAHLVEQVEMRRAGTPEAWADSKAWAKYPHLLSRLLDPIAGPSPTAGPVAAADVEERLAEVARPYRRGRALVALLSALLVPATWWLARRFFGPAGSLFACALVATSLLHLNFSWQGRPHGPLATFTTLALAASLGLRRDPSWRSYWGAGLLAALAVACLHNGILVLPGAIVAHLLARREGGFWRDQVKLLVPVALLAAGVRLCYPFLFGGNEETTLQVRGPGLHQAGHHFSLDWMDGTGFARMVTELRWHDPLFLVLVPLGVAAALLALARGRRPSRETGLDLAVVLASLLPYFLVLGSFNKTFERFQLPLVPGYALLATFGVRELGRFAGRAVAEERRAVVCGGLAALVLAAPTVLAVRLASLARRPDTGELAARWIEEHLERTDRVLVRPDTSLPLLQAPKGFPVELDGDTSRRRPWQHHLRVHGVVRGARPWQLVTIPWRQRRAQGRLPISSKEDPRIPGLFRNLLRELDGDYALVEVHPGTTELGTVPQQVAKVGQFLVRISPFGDPEGVDDGPRPRLHRGYQNEDLVLRAWKARHWGPAYDLYRLP